MGANDEIEVIGNELAVLCRAHALIADLPGNSTLHNTIWWDINEAINQTIDREDMAVDPIEHAMWELTNDGHIEGLQALAEALLRRRDDHGQWAAL